MKKYYFLAAVCATTLLAVAPMTSHASEDVSPSSELPLNPEISSQPNVALNDVETDTQTTQPTPSSELPIDPEVVGQMEDELNNALNDVQNGVQPDIIAEKEDELNNALNDVENGIQPELTVPTPKPSTDLPITPEFVDELEHAVNNKLNEMEQDGGIQPHLNIIGEPATPELPSVPNVADPMPMPLEPETNMPMLPSVDQPLVELEGANSLTDQLALGDSQTNTPFVNLAASLKNNDLKTEKALDETAKGEKTFPQTGERSSRSLVATGIVTVFAALGTIILKKFR